MVLVHILSLCSPPPPPCKFTQLVVKESSHHIFTARVSPHTAWSKEHACFALHNRLLDLGGLRVRLRALDLLAVVVVAHHLVQLHAMHLLRLYQPLSVISSIDRVGCPSGSRRRRAHGQGTPRPDRRRRPRGAAGSGRAPTRVAQRLASTWRWCSHDGRRRLAVRVRRCSSSARSGCTASRLPARPS